LLLESHLRKSSFPGRICSSVRAGPAGTLRR
jgi:hypothetical protein